MLDLKADGNAVLLSVKVVPGASRTCYQGVLGDRAKIAVAAPPEKGKANKAVVALLAKLLNAPVRNISVVSGITSMRKTVRIEDVEESVVRAILQGDRSS